MIPQIILAAAAVVAPHTAHIDPKPHTRPPQVIFIPEDYPGFLDARTGDSIILIMNQDPNWVDRCLHFGGEPIYNPYTYVATCEDVDF